MTIDHSEQAPVSVTGWLAENWPAFAEAKCPPIIINPAASTGDVLAWCYGEAVSLEAVARVYRDDDGDVGRIFLHRLQPLVNALCAVPDLMAAEIDCTAVAVGSGRHG